MSTDPLSLVQLYRSMRVRELLLLQEAFVLDASANDSPANQAFCEERMLLIRQVLKAKAARKARKLGRIPLTPAVDDASEKS